MFVYLGNNMHLWNLWIYENN